MTAPREGLERVALDACAKCMTGLRDGGWNHYPESFCSTDGCHNYRQSVPWIGLREHVKVMWPAPLMAVVEAAREIVTRVGALCRYNDTADTYMKRTPELTKTREALTAWDHYLEGEPAAQEER